MTERLTKWEGQDPDGTPRAVLAKREGSWPENEQDALRKLARLEDKAERGHLKPVVLCSECRFVTMFPEGDSYCQATGGMFGRVRENDFCSTGRRREAET